MNEEPAARADWLRHVSGWNFVTARPQRLGVAVSGGSDSMALLDLMAWHAADKGFEVRAVTVDHGLRPEAKAEAASVAAFCGARGIRHDILHWKEWDGTGNLQARARKARYGLMVDWALREDVGWIALGHTKDDQAETVLMRIARRSGVDGLAGMPSRFKRDGVTMIRPLLQTERNVLRNYLRDRGIGWCEDPSNEDDTFERVRARKAMTCLSGIGIDADTLATVADNAEAARWALDHYAWREVSENGIVREDRGDLILPERFLTPKHKVPTEVGRRLLIAALRWVTGAEYPPRRSAFLGIDAGLMDADRHTVGGCLISRIKAERPLDNSLRISREYNAVKDLRGPTDQVWDGRWCLDGPHAPDLEIRALGEAVKDTIWRETGMPRASLMATPAVWRGDDLVSAPVAGLTNGWTASATGRGNFTEFLLSR